MTRKEASQHEHITTWIRWYMAQKNRNVKVELKHTRGSDSFPFSELPEHQLNDLMSFEFSPFVHKFDDAGYRKKPCDFLGTTEGDSFIAIRYDEFIAVIRLKNYLYEIKHSERKSISSSRAKYIAYSIINR